MNIRNSYFSLGRPVELLDRWLHPLKYHAIIDYLGKDLKVSWTKRVEHALQKRNSPLIVEMQIYFSCVVQKRVLFHEQIEHDTIAVNNQLSLVLRPVQADSCDPIEFAKNHPVAHEYTTQAAQKFRPSHLRLDFKNSKWCGEFSI